MNKDNLNQFEQVRKNKHNQRKLVSRLLAFNDLSKEHEQQYKRIYGQLKQEVKALDRILSNNKI